MKAYIAISYSKRELFNKEIIAIKETLNEFKIASLVFVDSYKFEPADEKKMMEEVMTCIADCDILIAETSNKGIGIGIEVGYAKAKSKIVIYIRQKNAAHSTTVSGISDFQIVYNDVEELQVKLVAIIKKYRRHIAYA